MDCCFLLKALEVCSCLRLTWVVSTDLNNFRKSEALSAEAIKNHATAGRRCDDGGATVILATRKFPEKKLFSSSLYSGNPIISKEISGKIFFFY